MVGWLTYITCDYIQRIRCSTGLSKASELFNLCLLFWHNYKLFKIDYYFVLNFILAYYESYCALIAFLYLFVYMTIFNRRISEILHIWYAVDVVLSR